MTATELSAYDVPFSKIESLVMSWVDEALDLRHGSAGDEKGPLRGWGSTDDSPSEIMDLLLRVRVRSDRVDELLSKVTQARGRAKRAKDEAAFAADVALITATQNRAARRVEFSTGKEREADAKLDSLEERRIAHQADRLVSTTNEAYEVINQVHWQLDAIRKDLRASLHALQFESSLER